MNLFKGFRSMFTSSTPPSEFECLNSCRFCSSCSRPVPLRSRKFCYSCDEVYCPQCMEQTAGINDKCARCAILFNRNPSWSTVSELSTKDLKWYLRRHNISSDGFIEKSEFVRQVLEHLGIPCENPRPAVPPSRAVSQQNFASAAALNTGKRTAASCERVHLAAMQREEDLNNLSVRQLKNLLAYNFVDYNGCLERQELLAKAQRLWRQYKRDVDLAEQSAEEACGDEGVAKSGDVANKEAHKPNPHHCSQPPPKLDAVDECCICMEAPANCVLLECGHMIACVSCGRKLKECPICRENVVRAVRTFRS